MKYITSITLIGDSLSQEALSALQKLGVVKVAAQETVELIYAPPPVTTTEKYHLHQKGILGVKTLLNMIRDGVTLINYTRQEMLIRIYNGNVYLFKGNLYAEMALEDFLQAFKSRARRTAASGVKSILIKLDEEFLGKIHFIVHPQIMGFEMAKRLMNWDGIGPASSTKSTNARYLVKEKGVIGAHIFLQAVKSGVTHFNQGNKTLIRIDGIAMGMYQGSTQSGQYATMMLEDFLTAFEAVTGPNLKRRLDKILATGDLANSKIKWLQAPIYRDRLTTLQLMRWNASLEEMEG